MERWLAVAIVWGRMAMTLEFRLLGDVAVFHHGGAVELGHARQRCVLAVLLVDAGRAVPVDALLDRVWAGSQPRHARNALSGYVSRLRQVLAACGEERLRRAEGGYRLAVDPLSVDLHRFHDLVAKARAATDDRTALDRYDQALDLWHGTAFATLDTPWLGDMRATLDTERHAAALDRNDLALRLGRHADLLGELAAWADAHPLDERVAGQLMQALYRSGRQADALRQYELVRSTLAEELGADPSPPLRELHLRILNSDQGLAHAIPAAPERPVVSGRPVPRQLPTQPRFFVGRARELGLLDLILDDNRAGIAVITGTGGVGKTALALHWAHRVADRFPDGQLYVNFRSFDPNGSVLSTDEALRGFLDALDVSADHVPAERDVREALYRSLLATRRMLIVLDNVRDAGQVRALFPGASASSVVVTSRDRLAGLVINEGAHPIPLDLLSDSEAHALIAQRIGEDRIAADPDAVVELIARCAGLPLALAIAAARTATQYELDVRELADELRDRQGLESLSSSDPLTDPRTVFSWSYRILSPPAAKLFRLLGIHVHSEFALTAAASLVGRPVPDVRPLLAELTDAHLVTERSPCRFVMHDLLYAYAIELVHQHDTETERHHATLRMLGHYLHTIHTANQKLRFRHDHHEPSPVDIGVTIETISDHRAAMRWLIAERPTLLAAVQRAAEAELHTHTWQLAQSLTIFLGRRGRWLELVTVQQTALDAALNLDDPSAQAKAHHALATGTTQLDMLGQAYFHTTKAICLYRQDGDPLGEARIHLDLAATFCRRGHTTTAVHYSKVALDLCLELGDPITQSFALNAVAWTYATLGVELHQAISYCEQAIALQRETGDQRGEATTWGTLGYTHHQLGQYDKAITYYQRALKLHAMIGEPYDETIILTHIGHTLHANGNGAAAREAWNQALSILVEIDHPDADKLHATLHESGDRDLSPCSRTPAHPGHGQCLEGPPFAAATLPEPASGQTDPEELRSPTT